MIYNVSMYLCRGRIVKQICNVAVLECINCIRIIKEQQLTVIANPDPRSLMHCSTYNEIRKYIG